MHATSFRVVSIHGEDLLGKENCQIILEIVVYIVTVRCWPDLKSGVYTINVHTIICLKDAGYKEDCCKG
jgi:hypothetical protein